MVETLMYEIDNHSFIFSIKIQSHLNQDTIPGCVADIVIGQPSFVKVRLVFEVYCELPQCSVLHYLNYSYVTGIYE